MKMTKYIDLGDLKDGFTLEYDNESVEFKTTLHDYREVIDFEGSVEDLLEYLAVNIVHGNPERLIEGVGYLSWRNGDYSGYYGDDNDGLDSGITLVDY